MGRKVLYALTIIGVLLLIGAIAGGVAIFVSRSNSGEVPEHTILEVDFTGGLVEYVPQDPVAQALYQRRPTVQGTVRTLERAADDDRVVMLLARVGTGFSWPGKVQELRDAVLHFRSRGKKAIAYVESFGFGYAGTTNYYLATAFDEIYVLPIGSVSLSGLALEVQFLRGALDKLGVEPQMDSRWEYKTAKDVYLETELTDAAREAYGRIIESQFERIAADIASARGLTVERVNELADRGLLSAAEAVEAGLIDGVAYRDEVFEKVESEAPEGAERLFFYTYAARSDPPPEDSPVIALVYGVGSVVQGKSEYNPLTGGLTMGSDSVTAALRAAVKDDEVKAILFRIDSGGGSAVASQIMWRETLRAQAHGIPVIASMSDVAGSGGYFIAMGADKIVAQPGTITGSIGVVAGKMVTKNFFDKLGISFDEVRTHPNASMWNGIREFTPEQWDAFQGWLDEIYAVFTQGVADGRNLDIERVREIAKGRIWTGADALEIGLVDALGGFPTAIRLAKEAAGIAEDEPIQLRVFPRPKTPLQLIIQRITGQGGSSNSGDATAALLARTLEALQPLGRVAAQLGLGRRADVLELRMPSGFGPCASGGACP